MIVHVHCFCCYNWYAISETSLSKWDHKCPKCESNVSLASETTLLPDYPYTKGGYSVRDMKDILIHATNLWTKHKDRTNLPAVFKNDKTAYVAWQVIRWAEGDGIWEDAMKE